MQPFQPLTLEELLRLRPKTDLIAGLLRKRLERHIDTLSPLLDPARVLGKVSGSGRTAWMERSLTDFKQLHEKYGRPFRMSEEFHVESLNDASTRLELHPWEYDHNAQAGAEGRQIKMTSPTRWILTYSSDYSPERVKAALSNREGQTGSIHRFVLNSLLLHMVIAKSPRVVEILRDLRFEVSSVPCPELHDLPLVSISFALPSYRPDDGLILKATILSGVHAFIELVDLEALRSMSDSLKQELESAVA